MTRKLLAIFVLLQFGWQLANAEKSVCNKAFIFHQQSEKKDAQKKTNSEDNKNEKKKSDYRKLFDKEHVAVHGFMTLRKVKDKLYCEFPEIYLGKDFAIASTVVKTSENGHAIVGQKPHPLMHVRFEMIDSCIYMTEANHYFQFKRGDKIEHTFKSLYQSPIVKKFEIKAHTPDKRAYVLDVSSLFLEDNKKLDPFAPGSYSTSGGKVSRTTKYVKANSLISSIQAFPDNVMIESTLSYEVSLKFMGLPLAHKQAFTAVMKRSLFLLPENKMDIRIADPRIGYFTSKKFLFQDEKKTSKYWLAHRWKLEPKNKEAYLNGQLVEPVKPIVFYIDDKFPETWKPYIKKGIEQWNRAFERAGFKNVVQTKDFPKNDSSFSIANIRYNCVLYAPSPNPNATGPSWVDPRTGEIINASVYIFHDLIKLLHNWRFLQTAQLDSRVRKETFSDELMGDCIRYVCSHEVGHCLGLMHNMAASAAFSVDSLRSVSFTQKHGTTASIMDYARYNYVAQPEDKGVKLSPPELGEYDKYAIEWGYRYFGEENPKRDQKILANMISEKSGNPVYRYGKQQIRSAYDPSSQTEDLGNDPVKASEYGIRNLKYILNNMSSWFESFDYDYSYTSEKYDALKQQYIAYMMHINNVIGGIYLNEKFRGDKLETYRSVSREKQRNALMALLKEVKEMDWILNPDVLKNQAIKAPYVLNLQSQIISSLIRKDADIAFSCYLSEEENPYTPQEFYDDLIDHFFLSTKKGKNLTKNERDCQNIFVKALLGNKASQQASKSKSQKSLLDEYHFNKLKSINGMNERLEYVSAMLASGQIETTSGFGFQGRVNPSTLRDVDFIKYASLEKVKKIIIKKKKTGNKTTQSHYKFLLQLIG